MVIAEGALAGFQAGAGSRSLSGIGGFIRNKLAEAKQKGLLSFKEGLEGGKTKKVFQTTSTGETVPVTFGENQQQTDFAKEDLIFSKSEGTTEAEQGLLDEEALQDTAFMKRRRLAREKAEAEEGNVIQQGASKTLAQSTASGLVSEDIQARQRAIQFLKANGANVNEENIQAVIQRELQQQEG